MPKGSDKDSTDKDLSKKYPDLAKKDVKLITYNLLGVGKKVEESNPKAKHSRRMENQVRQAVQRLKQKKNKTDAEEKLLGSVKDKLSVDYYKKRQARQQKERK